MRVRLHGNIPQTSGMPARSLPYNERFHLRAREQSRARRVRANSASLEFARLACIVCAITTILFAPSIHAQVVRPEQRPGSMSGIVQTAPGRPAIGSTIAIVGTVFQTLVLPDGTFRIDNVPPGVYDITASGPQYRTTTIEDITVRPSQTTTLTITLKSYPLLSDVRVTTPWRRAQPIYESSMSVTVIKPTEAPFIAGHSLERVLESAAGATLNGVMPSIRGSSGGAIDVGSRVGLFIDGMPLTSPDLDEPMFAAIPFAAIEQVEIARGSATTVYGPGVISGAINVITPQPSERQRANVSVYTGVYTDPGSGTVRWWGARPQRFSGAEAMWTQRSKHVGLLVAGTLISDDGYRQHDPQDRYNVFGRINVFMSRGAELRVSGILSRHEHGPQMPWRNADSALFAPSSDSLGGPVATSMRALSAEYRGVDSKSFSFIVRGTLQAVGRVDDRADSISSRSSSSRYLGEMHLTSYLNRRITFSYGGLAQFDLAESPQFGDGLTRTVGAYCRMEFTNLQDIVASIGSRFDMVLMPGADEANVLEFSPSVGVAYHPIPSTSFRASITRGYRAPSIAERLFETSRFGIPVVPNPALGPEQSWQGEVGSAHRLEFSNASLTGDVAVYVHEYFAMIEPVFNSANGQITFANTSRARILGIDIAIEGNVDGGLIGATLALAAVSARDLRAGIELSGRSPLTASASLSWRPKPFMATLSYRYNARVPLVDAATERIVNDADRRVGNNVVDVSLALDLKSYIRLPMSIYANARNLLQAETFDRVGWAAPIRNVEVGFAVRL